VAEDFNKAIYWFRKAANHVIAQDFLGQLYAEGKGVTQDQSQAIYWFTKAAKEGGTRFQNRLGLRYQLGDHVPLDKRQAVYWYTMAANNGHPDAQNSLGVLYFEGDGVEKDERNAVYWYTKAANNSDIGENGDGDIVGQMNLAWAYANGKGVAQDYALAAHWTIKAAENGNTDARAHLISLYANGRGVPQDYEQAYAWIATLIYEKVTYEERVSENLSPDLIYRLKNSTGNKNYDFALKQKKLIEPRLTPKVIKQAMEKADNLRGRKKNLERTEVTLTDLMGTYGF